MATAPKIEIPPVDAAAQAAAELIAASEAAAAAAEAAKEAAAAAEIAAAAAAASPPPEVAAARPEMGTNVLVSGAIADQVNPLTNQRIAHGAPGIAVYDRWIEIQIEAGVLVRSKL